MICHTCGRVIKNEEANFCEYCGASFRGENAFDIKSSPVAPVSEPVIASPKEKPVSFLNWLGSQLLILVPYVGLVMLFIWAFGHNTPVSKKNWARAMLVIMLISGIMLLALLSSVGLEGFIGMLLGDITEYNNSIY
ncbi:MAG TPA: hypothetical protein PK304_04805 [Mobilitalea sp.]|nr:hypothetical protein [Mobilitalea sp.]